MTKKRKIRREDTRLLSAFEKIIRAYDNDTGVRLNVTEVQDLILVSNIEEIAENDTLDREWMNAKDKAEEESSD